MLSKYFSQQEALWLPQWNRLAEKKDGLNDKVLANIERMAKVMDEIRIFFNAPITVVSWYRPPAYNKEIGGAPFSFHREGLAVDFVVHNCTSDNARKLLLPLLTSLKIRMEDLPGSTWVHVDLGMPLNGNRYFKP